MYLKIMYTRARYVVHKTKNFLQHTQKKCVSSPDRVVGDQREIERKRRKKLTLEVEERTFKRGQSNINSK